MMFIFDTSSFVSLARYYLPFDSKGRIYHHVKTSIETGQANDNKAFRKLLAICDQLDIPTIPLPEYLVTCEDLNMSFG